MSEHDWRRHGPFLACTACLKVYRVAIAQEPCKKAPKGKKPKTIPTGPPCSICGDPLYGNDLEAYVESDGDCDTHLECIRPQIRLPNIPSLTAGDNHGNHSASGGRS